VGILKENLFGIGWDLTTKDLEYGVGWVRVIY
jgi:hypothetical protein